MKPKRCDIRFYLSRVISSGCESYPKFVLGSRMMDVHDLSMCALAVRSAAERAVAPEVYSRWSSLDEAISLPVAISDTAHHQLGPFIHSARSMRLPHRAVQSSSRLPVQMIFSSVLRLNALFSRILANVQAMARGGPDCNG